MESRAEQLLALGQSVWLDFIRRRDLQDGSFATLVRDAGVVGVTSNPTIFQQAIAGSADYDASLHRHAATGLSGPALFETLAIEDIQQACDQLAALAEKTGGLDGRVSIEVSPRLAHDTSGTVEEARRLHSRVARENVLIKVPATPEGLPAISSLIADGISINVTLIFSLARYRQVMDAYLTGLERRVAAGGSVARIYSVASFFVSRVDTKVDKAIEARMAALPEGSRDRSELEGYLGKVAVANARLAYAEFLEVFASARFKSLRSKGAQLQRPLWASTGTKNPGYSDVLYVDELIGVDTVNTMPPQTLAAFNDHGKAEVRITRGLDAARRAFERLPALGVPVDDLIAELEPEGVAAFIKSYESLLETLESRRLQMAGGAR